MQASSKQSPTRRIQRGAFDMRPFACQQHSPGYAFSSGSAKCRNLNLETGLIVESVGGFVNI